MTDLDLERLGDVWRQPPSDQAMAELKRAAEAVRRRARWSQLVDLVSALVVAAVVAVLVLRNPEADTLLVGGGAIVVLLLSQIRARKLRAEELKGLTGTSEQMLDQSITRVTATIKRTRLSLYWLPLGILLGLVVAFVVERRSGGELMSRVAEQPGLGRMLQVICALAIAAMVVHLVRTLRRSRRELERLEAMRDAYRRESAQ
ncbi:MAG: hypothetical protein ACT4OE_10020 [Sphingosinicella sp.]